MGHGHARLVHISGFLLEFERQILEARGKAGWKLPKSAEGDGFGVNSVNAKETILNEYEWISTCIHEKKQVSSISDEVLCGKSEW